MANHTMRPVPGDFAEIAPKLSVEGIVKHYHTSRVAAKRWLSETGVQCRSSNNVTNINKAMPEDFPQVAPTMCIGTLRRHYGAGLAAITRWLKEANVKPKQYVPGMNWGGAYKRNYGNLAQTANSTEYDDAANILRKRGPVYRCNEKGAYQQAGRFWRVGWSVLTPDELLERAARYREKAA